VPLAPREAVRQLESLLRDLLGGRLEGLYLFGSLAAGGFHEDRSDVDLFAVLRDAVAEADADALRGVHADFASRNPEWHERVEVGYVPRSVVATFASEPEGTIIAISPGEPLHLRGPEWGWVLNWRSVCRQGERIFGPPPLEVGPEVTPEVFRRAIEMQLREWRDVIREDWVAYVPAARGYAVVTHCRALYALATGEQASKEEAVAWVAQRHPEWADYVRARLADHRADIRGARGEAVAFADWARGVALGDGSVVGD
jgi:predicted nucleotidyltransferase